jgi:hypothetical protein
MTDKPRKRRPYFQWAAFFVIFAAVIYGGYQAMVHPKNSLPSAWNPARPLAVKDDLSPLTQWKLKRTLKDPMLCQAALTKVANAKRLPDFIKDEKCNIIDQVELRSLGQSSVKPFNTRCQLALRIAMWEHHGIQIAALKHVGQPVREIKHYSSYSCREMRTTNESAGRMSAHATAEAIDVSGFILEDGREIKLTSGWEGTLEERVFLREVRNSACKWFQLTLSPDYNALHADHFHLQHKGWGACR